jgi:mono/diheme cytochrome c family protein
MSMARTVLVALVAVGMTGGVLSAEQGAAAAATGEKVFAAQKCIICHSIAGKGNKNGPLDDVGNKLSAADIRAWIVTPAEMGKKQNATRKPPMKSFASLPAADIDALVAYLQTLKLKS